MPDRYPLLSGPVMLRRAPADAVQVLVLAGDAVKIVIRASQIRLDQALRMRPLDNTFRDEICLSTGRFGHRLRRRR